MQTDITMFPEIKRISMSRLEKFEFIKLFGDGKPHTWYNIQALNSLHFKNVFHQQLDHLNVDQYLKEMMRNGLIERVDTPEITKCRGEQSYALTRNMYDYIITNKGDNLLRGEQMAREGNAFYYKGFNRTPDDHYADNIRLPKKEI
jgi:hypothetical protein